MKSNIRLSLRALYLTLGALPLGLALPTCPGPAGNTTIKWSTCPDDPALGKLPSSVECGEIMVPLDHANPAGESISLVMTRLKARKPSKSHRSLFLQAGGPGESTSNLVKYQAIYEETGDELYRQHSPELRDAFDLIGLDMRGEGMSQPIYCDPDAYNLPHKMMATDEESFAQLSTRNRAFAESCYNLTGPLFTHLGTDQVIQDVDVVRQALGDEKLNFFAFSYGTQVGSQYAARYPDKVGQMVIDGNLDHSMTVPQSLIELAVGAEASLEFFFRWCNTTSDCALYGQDQRALWDEILAFADNGTFISTPCKETGACPAQVDAESFIFTAQGLMTFGNPATPMEGATKDYYVLARALDSARNGNATAFSGHYQTGNSSADADGSSYSFPAIFCSDWKNTISSAAEAAALYTAAGALAPRTRGIGTMSLAQFGCVGWPFEPTNPQTRLEFGAEAKAQLPPIMVAGSFFDEATSVQWSVQQRWMLPGAFNVWRNGGGHTDYHFMGEMQKAIDAFLINGTVPVDGTVYPN